MIHKEQGAKPPLGFFVVVGVIGLGLLAAAIFGAALRANVQSNMNRIEANSTQISAARQAALDAKQRAERAELQARQALGDAAVTAQEASELRSLAQALQAQVLKLGGNPLPLPPSGTRPLPSPGCPTPNGCAGSS